jgi:hypothetical protein
MSTSGLARQIGVLGATLGLLAPAACGGSGATPRGLPGGHRLIQKREFQALYAPDGRIMRLLRDGNRDGRADAVVVYRPTGKPERGEIDTDEDGAVDRWEHFRTDGTLDRVDLDTDHDGRVDRTDSPR